MERVRLSNLINKKRVKDELIIWVEELDDYINYDAIFEIDYSEGKLIYCELKTVFFYCPYEFSIDEEALKNMIEADKVDYLIPYAQKYRDL